MKIKGLNQLVLILVALAIVSGCSTKYASHTGTSLTRPSKGTTTLTVESIHNKPFFVGKRGERRTEILPGKMLGISFQSREKVELEFTWADDLGRRDQDIIEFKASYIGLYNETIYVDEAFLTGLIGVPVIITNDSPEAIRLKDTCMLGIPIVIPADGYYWTIAIPGVPYEYSWWPAENVDRNQVSPQSVCTSIPAKADKIFMGKRYARGIHIKRARPGW